MGHRPPRTQMSLRGNKLRMTTSPRVTLGSSKNSGSWLVKTYHYIRIGCDRISQRAAQGSLYRGAGRQRRSERLKVAPYTHGRWPCFFVTCDCVIPIAWLRCHRGRPKGVPPWSLCIPGFYDRWLVVRKNLPLYSNRLWWNLSGELPLYCGPFQQPSCHSLQSWPDGLKRHGKPLQFGHGPCIFVTCDCVIPIAWLRFRRGRPGGYSGGRPATRWGLPEASLLVWVCRGGTPHLSRRSVHVARPPRIPDILEIHDEWHTEKEPAHDNVRQALSGKITIIFILLCQLWAVRFLSAEQLTDPAIRQQLCRVLQHPAKWSWS